MSVPRGPSGIFVGTMSSALSRIRASISVLGVLTVMVFFLGVDLGGVIGGRFDYFSLIPVILWSLHFAVYWLTVRTLIGVVLGGLLLYCGTILILIISFNDEASTAGVWLGAGPFMLLTGAVVLGFADYFARLRTGER